MRKKSGRAKRSVIARIITQYKWKFFESIVQNNFPKTKMADVTKLIRIFAIYIIQGYTAKILEIDYKLNRSYGLSTGLHCLFSFDYFIEILLVNFQVFML